MGGFFGAVGNRDVVLDVFFGTDYHSHLGTVNAGMAVWDAEKGCNRQIHSIKNVPFRTKFEEDLPSFSGNCGIGCISDSDPQPLMLRLRHGLVAMAAVCMINNAQDIIDTHFIQKGHHFMSMSDGRINVTELVAALINEKDDLVSGIRYAQEQIDGTMSLIMMTGPGEIIASRDAFGRLPILIGKGEDGYCVSFESFAYHKLGYEDSYELGPGEIVSIRPDGFRVLSPARDKMKICAFLWSYYGYPNSNYEGVNVEVMRNKNGAIMAKAEIENGTMPKDLDAVAGVPDSGVPHAIGFANESGVQFSRPFIKYTPTWPRSFMPDTQKLRNQIAKMKIVPVPELIKDKKLMFIDDSIVRGTQLQGTVNTLYEAGAAEVHMRSACPPIMYACKYLNFSRGNSDMELLTRRVIQEIEGDEGQKHVDEYADASTERGKCMLKAICEKFGFDSLGYQDLDGMLEAIGIDKDQVCTYCWTGKE